jgi:hypothetical protein
MKQNKKSAKHHKKLKENPNEYNYQFSNSNILSSSSSTSEFKTVLTNKALLDSFPNAKQDKIKELRNGMKNEIKSNKSEIDNNKSPQIIDSPFLTLIPISNHKNIKNQQNNINTPIGLYKQEKEEVPIKKKYINGKTNYTNSFIGYINEDQFFNIIDEPKPFIFPKQLYKIKTNQINHDINYFNHTKLFPDHLVNYAHDSYKTRKLYEQDEFVNFIKSDLMTQKFGNKIKLFDEF